MANYADELAVKFADHQVDLYRYEAQQRKDIISFLLLMQVEVEQAILKANLGSSRVYDVQRLEDLLKEIEQIIKQYYRQARNFSIRELKELMGSEYMWAANTLLGSAGATVINVQLTEAFLASVVSDVLIEGAPSKEWWNRQATSTLNKFKDQIRAGLFMGETNEQLVNRVIGKRVSFENRILADGTKRRVAIYQGGIMDTERHKAEALVRTSVQAVANDSKWRLYEDNEDLIFGYQQLSVLDKRTSDICIARSGKAWTVDGKPIGNHNKRFRIPPLHFNCRSILLPILKSWQDLPGKVRTSLPGSMQASMDGQVSAEETYEDMLKRRSVTDQKRILGKGRYELWKAGKLTLSDLTDQDDRPLTLKELRKAG